MKRNSVFVTVGVTVLFILSTVLFTPTQASGIVGSGTPDSCTEAALDAALSAGGTVNFYCGSAPTVIPITSEKVITQNTILNGGGTITISGKNASRIFRVASGAQLQLQKLTLAYGAAMDPADGSNRNGSGGAILNEGGTVMLTDSTVTSSRADHNGGGIYNRAGTLTLIRTTISGNYVSDNGGGVINEQGTAVLDNVTLSGNFAGRNGGALFNFGGTVTLIHDTIYNNNSGLSASGILNTTDGKITAQNTIVANNQANGSPVTGNCSGAIADGGTNLQFPDNSCGTSIQVADPKLASLADNGGFAFTHALKDGSPAIDTASSGPCKADPTDSIDERQVKRPIGTGCDIGAYEYDARHPGKDIVILNNGDGSSGSVVINSTLVVVVTPNNSCTMICATLTPTPKKPTGCPPGFVYNPNYQKCICPPPAVYNPNTNRCDPPPTTGCPNGTISVNGKCVTPTPPPPPPAQCPNGTISINGKCVTPTPPPPMCPNGQIPDAAKKCCPVGNGYDINPKTGLCEQHPG